MSVWRHLTHPDGMTVSLLVTATGLSAEQVRAELRALEQDGKACRERAPERPARSAAAAQHSRRQSCHPENLGLVGNGKASAPHRGRRRYPLRIALQPIAILNP